MTAGGALLGIDNIGQPSSAHFVAVPALVSVTQPVCKHICMLEVEGQEPLIAADFQSHITKNSSHALDPNRESQRAHTASCSWSLSTWLGVCRLGICMLESPE